VDDDLTFCRRRAVDLARLAVYSRDQETRQALARMAQGWAELARAVGSVEPISAEFRLAAEFGYPATKILPDADKSAPTESQSKHKKKPRH